MFPGTGISGDITTGRSGGYHGIPGYSLVGVENGSAPEESPDITITVKQRSGCIWFVITWKFII
ncbi:hypothetical protein SAMN04488128_102607 [Chitinophaga eiseniae]|uniref:Uncharacterized protein n=1 Tax=Chitinophaga eiseniae TaxID=634771 RepID=A0A1T4QVA3_9BACT|nr:hypothetical protein SAMN04488128_102607 [Chitinophaga eiseniae]